MSMNTYPIQEKAVLLIHGKLAAAINAIDWMINGDPDPTVMDDETFIRTYGDDSLAYDAMEYRDVENLCHCSEFEGETESINGQETCNYTFDDDFLCYIAARKEPSLFSAAYGKFEDIKHEFEDILDAAGLMKTVNDFHIDIGDYICSLNGTYFC